MAWEYRISVERWDGEILTFTAASKEEAERVIAVYRRLNSFEDIHIKGIYTIENRAVGASVGTGGCAPVEGSAAKDSGSTTKPPTQS